MRKLKRQKLELPPNATILNFASNNNWKIPAESGSPLNAECLAQVEGGDKVFEQLLIWSRGQAKKRATVNNVLRYLKYVSSIKGSIGRGSLLKFKEMLDTESKAQANTKNQVFGMCKNFVDFLMSADVIPSEMLPKNFELIRKKAKPSIMELVGDAMADFVISRQEKTNIKRLRDKHSLTEDEAIALAYGNHVLDKYHELSLNWIEKWFEDCHFVDSLIEGVNEEEATELKKITNFKESDGDWKRAGISNRSLTAALKILYVKFGRLIPSSNDWPPGIADYCKNKGWAPRKIQSTFFTSAYNLQYFLVAALSHRELAPNVDSIVFHAYTDAFKPANEKGMLSVHFGKKRGAPLDTVLPRKDRICVVYFAYQKRLKKILSEVEGGDTWLRKEECEIFLHYTKVKGKHSIRLFDVSLPSNMVRRVTKELAAQHPIFLPLIDSVSGENFRSTISALDILSGSSISKLKAKLNHRSISTTEGYAIRTQTESVNDKKFVSFQEFLISNRKTRLPDTGSGYMCGKNEHPDLTCKGLDMCFECPAKRLVLKNLKLIAEWLAHKDWIKANKDRLLFNNPERWHAHWAVKLAEYEALLDECTGAEVRNAKQLADEIKLPFMD